MEGEEDSVSELRVSLLAQRLFLVGVRREFLHLCVKALLKLTFFPNNAAFFSYTETEDEVSLILDEGSVEYLKEEAGTTLSITTSPGCWKAIQVFEGASAINETGIISHLSSPLTEDGIPIIYLSTYETDLILVQEGNVERACECLQRIVAQSGSRKRSISNEARTPGKEMQLDFTVSTLPSPLVLAVFSSKEALSQAALPLIHHLFFASGPQGDRCFSVTSSPHEVSLILDKEAAASFPSEVLRIHPDVWRAIQVGEGPSGFTGKNVSVISATLASAGISIYYLSTFNTDFILVPERSVEDALSCLSKKYHIQLEDQ